MKAVILAGGYGTRISEESALRPKPMIDIGGDPILWHIMKIYAFHGITDFIICLGYKGYAIKEYFFNYALHRADVTIDLASRGLTYHHERAEPWKVTLVDTGLDTLTGGRLRQIGKFLDQNEPFCMTYGDGLANIDIKALVTYHKTQGRKATLTAVRPPGRYGVTQIEGGRVTQFLEKPAGDGSWINGGFFVLHPDVLSRIKSDDTPWEAEPLQGLAKDGELSGYRHDGFWQPMDTLRDKNYLESLWQSGNAPWKVWP
jgi:glucose-1-phosphate cytidylyltransferase